MVFFNIQVIHGMRWRNNLFDNKKQFKTHLIWMKEGRKKNKRRELTFDISV